MEGNEAFIKVEAVGDNDVVTLGELREVVFDLEAIEVVAVGER